MKQRYLGLACAALFAVASTAVAQGGSDVIELSNGDKMTGTVVSFGEGEVVFNTPMVGDVTVPQDNIVNITTAEPVTLVVTNANGEKETYSRRITSLRDGNLTVAGDGGADLGPIDFARVQAINPPEDPGWIGFVNLGAYNFSGNTDRRGVNASAFAQRRFGDAGRVTGDVAWDYAQDKDANAASPTFLQWRLTQRRTTVGAQYDHFLSETSYLWLSTRFTGDTLADLSLRTAVSGGYGAQWYDTDDFKLNTEVGLAYINEAYRSNTPTREYLSARVAYRLFKQITESIKLLQYVEAFPSLEDADDIFLRADTRLQMSLTESMFAEIKYELDYDNTPSPLAPERADHRVFASLGWSF